MGLHTIDVLNADTTPMTWYPSETARQRYDPSRNREGHEIPMMPKSSRFLVLSLDNLNFV